MSMSLALALHILGVVIWVGGMFFAHMALRPAAVEILQAPFRLRLWVAVFSRFFPWVWIAILAILASGYFIIFVLIGGFATTAIYVHIMHGLGLIMVAIFLHIYFAPFNRLKKAVATESWEQGGSALAQIRLLVTTNLLIGLITIVIATVGRFFIH
jgi:uncharacterized membrane protein